MPCCFCCSTFHYTVLQCFGTKMRLMGDDGDRFGSRRQMEVSYALPDRTLIISRPPKNRLPLVDFSYRPLFASLSVTNILCIFGLLLTEAKVILYEKSSILYIYTNTFKGFIFSLVSEIDV